VLLGGKSLSSYWTTRCLFFLDGTIITVGENKYFKDLSSTARNFLITGYDFDSTWTKGFPYKSAATISAPAADAALIAADINNFLYAGDGTPNQIPVVSLFQNIDYANTIYCKHVAQAIDANGVETYEPRVLEIFMTAAALSAADLTKANTYFGVPAEQTSNVKWVDPVNGVDATGNGSKLTPWKTLTKAEASSSDGDLVYVKTGLCNETNYWQPRLNRHWKAIGLNVTRSTGTTYVLINSLANHVEITGFNFDSETNTTYALYVAGDTKFYKCRTINPVVSATSNTAYIANDAATFTHCVFVSGTTSGRLDLRSTFTLDTCFVSTKLQPSTAAKVFTLTNCKIKANVSGAYWCNNFNVDSALTIKGGKFIVDNAVSVIFSDVAALTKSISITYMSIVINALQTAFLRTDTGSFATATFSNNTLVNNSNAQIFSSTSNTDYVIENNHIDIVGTASGIILSNTTASQSDVTINNNTVLKRTAAGYGISIGAEATSAGDNKFTNVTITNNKVLGQKYFTPAATPTSHGIFIGFQATTHTVKNNYINGHGMGIVLKGSNSDYSNCTVQSNIITASNDYGIYFKGAENSKVYGNTLKENGIEIYFTVNAGGDGAIGQTIKNNILYNSTGYLYKFDTDSYASHTIDYNVIYGTSKLAYNGSADVALAAWNAAGYDTHSETGDPLLTNFIPASNSPAIGNGETLDAAYDDGLYNTTVWGADTSLPVIVTKQQGAAWDIGAYVH
jgi:parallel beta-helix repeat protein